MNYLAHAWLARHADEAILGALLGDFVFGQAALLDWPGVVRGEIVAHRASTATPTRTRLRPARALFADWLRRYAGSCSTCTSTTCSRATGGAGTAGRARSFLPRAYRVLRERLRRAAAAPARSRRGWKRIDWPGSYRERDNVDHAVRGIATRLSRHGERLVACLPVLRANEAAIDAAFEAFFPELIAAAPRLRAGLPG
ncbi:MAG: ACP phosphodiesterase [Lysobacterales bacterium]